MKKLILAIAIAAIFAMGSAAYAGQFGPPEPAAKEGKASLGVGYFYSSAKWKYADDTEEISQNQAYLQLGYGFVKNAEVYIRVGGADLKIKDAYYSDTDGSTSDFKDSYKPFGTIGAKGVFNVSDSFGIGPFFQASLYSSYKDEFSESVTETETDKLKNLWEINLGVGLQGKIGDVIIYGGPVAYWAKSKIAYTWTDGTTTESGSLTSKEKGNIGGFAGVRIPLSKSLSLEVEGQMKSKFSMGGAITYSF